MLQQQKINNKFFPKTEPQENDASIKKRIENKEIVRRFLWQQSYQKSNKSCDIKKCQYT